MRSANAIKVHRKSGEAERRTCGFADPFVEMFFDRAERSAVLLRLLQGRRVISGPIADDVALARTAQLDGNAAKTVTGTVRRIVSEQVLRPQVFRQLGKGPVQRSGVGVVVLAPCLLSQGDKGVFPGQVPAGTGGDREHR